MQTPWLSILLPVYNVAEYLEDCFNSILGQDVTGIEIIAVNDCSTDNSLEILQAIQARAQHPITILQHSHNQGLSASRNTLLNAAAGRYVWFLDSDDALTANALSPLRDIVTQYEPDVVLCDFFMWRASVKLKHRLRGELHRYTFAGPRNSLQTSADQLFNGIYTQGHLHIWSKISKRSLWGDDLRFPVGRLMEDMVITPRLLLRANSYYYAPQVWVAYRQRPGSILATPSQKKLEDTSAGAEGVLDLWLQKYPTLSVQAKFAFVHFCSKSFIGVSRILLRDKSLDENHSRQLRHQHQQLFFRHTQTRRSWLWLQYLKRGWLWRGLRLLKHLR